MVFRRIFKRRRRRIIALSACLVVFIILVLLPKGHSALRQAKAERLLNKQAKFWRTTYQIILNNDPWCDEHPEVVANANLKVAYQSGYYRGRPDVMYMEDEDVLKMKRAHAKYIHDVFLDDLKPVYNRGTRGIITTVSAKSLPVLLVSLRMLRLTGSKLPVEVFLWRPQPLVEHLCSSIFPALNTRCVFVSDIFRRADTGVVLKSYQHKILAILFSTFEDILFLDSDAWPAINPDHLFDTSPFNDTGMITWPDFWFASESPYFFDIANVTKIPEVHERAASEAGILMYSKKKHGPSILLATYYNYFGPDYYYRLQSQNGPGEGDKETFGLAALVMREPFYAVKSPVTALGRHDSSGNWLGSAMVQFNPNVDWNISEAVVRAEKIERVAEEDERYHDINESPDRLRDTTKHTSAGSEADLKRLRKVSTQNNHYDPTASSSSHEKHISAEVQKQKMNKKKKHKKKLQSLPLEELLETDHSPPSIVAAAVSFTNGRPNTHPDLAYLQTQLAPTQLPTPQPLFIHTNYPKFDPRTIFTEKVNGAQTPTRDTNGTVVRCWDMTARVAKSHFGVDIERRLWSVVQTVACHDLAGSRRIAEEAAAARAAALAAARAAAAANAGSDQHGDAEAAPEETMPVEGEEKESEGVEVKDDAEVCADVKTYIVAVYPDLLEVT